MTTIFQVTSGSAKGSLNTRVSCGKLSQLQRLILVALSKARYAVMRRRAFNRTIKQLYYGKDSRVATSSLSRSYQRLEDRQYIVRSAGRWKLTDSNPLDNGVMLAFLAWAQNREFYARLGLKGNAMMDRQWAINATGVVANIRAAVKVLREGGRVISIGSGVATRAGFAGLADYAATKAAIVGYSKAAARDLAPRNITVNVIQAGLMDTDMFAPFKEAAPVMFSTIAIQRYAKLEEVAAGVVFLASPAASYITGAVIDIEGGYSA